LTAALLLRSTRLFWLKASIGLGVMMQAALLTTDVISMQIKLPAIGNPYRRTIGLKAYAERVGHLAEDRGAKVIVSDERGKFAVLRYYWRNKPVQILSWGSADSPSFDIAHPLTQSAPQPILFVSECPDETRVKPFFNDIQPLGINVVPVAEGADRYFFAVVVSNPRGPTGILRQCGP
jgi:hypothetical protein